jgi:16S rRNA (cytidine1402-2'-O)-methyltransferase
MSNKGKLVLIPNAISEVVAPVITPQVMTYLPDIRFFLAENIRSARRYLSSLKIYNSIEELHFDVLDKNTPRAELQKLMAPLFDGQNLGVISESGCPGIADPGSEAALYAHQNGITVVPLVGPSSIVLALMASGLNGQHFAFHGYLPIDKNELAKAIKAYELESRKKNQTQIFIETPYRNKQTLQHLLANLSPETLLTVAHDITGPQERIFTKKVKEWNSSVPVLEKLPVVFLFLA